MLAWKQGGSVEDGVVELAARLGQGMVSLQSSMGSRQHWQWKAVLRWHEVVGTKHGG